MKPYIFYVGNPRDADQCSFDKTFSFGRDNLSYLFLLCTCDRSSVGSISKNYVGYIGVHVGEEAKEIESIKLLSAHKIWEDFRGVSGKKGLRVNTS